MQRRLPHPPSASQLAKGEILFYTSCAVPQWAAHAESLPKPAQTAGVLDFGIFDFEALVAHTHGNHRIFV